MEIVPSPAPITVQAWQFPDRSSMKSPFDRMRTLSALCWPHDSLRPAATPARRSTGSPAETSGAAAFVQVDFELVSEFAISQNFFILHPTVIESKLKTKAGVCPFARDSRNFGIDKRNLRTFRDSIFEILFCFFISRLQAAKRNRLLKNHPDG